MTWTAVAIWSLVLVAAAAVSRTVARFLWAFLIAAALLLALHARAAPEEAAAGLAVLGGGLLAFRPLRKLALALGLA